MKCASTAAPMSANHEGLESRTVRGGGLIDGAAVEGLSSSGTPISEPHRPGIAGGFEPMV